MTRHYVKWDDQPASVEAALDSLARAYSVTRAAPSAPAYVCLDVTVQEQPLPEPPPIPSVQRDRSPRAHGPDAEAVRTTGIGSGPGMAVGAALALEGSGRLPVAVLGDGDFLMGGTALWTAAHYRLPLLIVVANNSSFRNDVVHAELMAGQRRRSARNSWIGQAISDPDPDLPAFARSLGFHAADQVRDRSALLPAPR